MGKKKNRGEMQYSVNDKLAKKCLVNINGYMEKIKTLIGNTGDGAAGGSKTLIGAIEGLNNEAKDGPTMTAAYDKVNNTRLENIGKVLRKVDSNLDYISRFIK